MSEKKQKTYQEWQEIVGLMGDRNFEELSYRILSKLGFEEIKHRGGSADGGRDLEGKRTYFEPDNQTKNIEKYWFECKCYSSSIPWKEVCDKLNSAILEKVDKFIVLSNRGLSPDAQDHVKKYMEQHKIKVIEWCGFKFLDLLFQHTDLCETYFPDIPTPNIPPEKDKSKHILKAVINLSEGLGLELQTEVEKDTPISEENVKKIIINSLRNIKSDNVEMNEQNKSILFNQIAMIFSQFGLNLDAMTFIENSIKIKETIENLINKAIIFERLFKLPEAEKIYKSILKKENNLIVLNNLSRNLKEQFLLDEALETINKALEIDPNFMPSINNKLQILKRLKRYEEALVLVNEKINDNSSIELQKIKVDILLESFDLKEAFRINEQLLELDPSDVDLINNKGVIYEHNAQFQFPEKYFQLAFETFGEARSKRKDYLLALSNQVVCFLNVGNVEEAESLTNSGLEFDRNNAHLLHNKAKIELRKGNIKSSLDFVEKAIKISSQEKFLLTKANILMILRRHAQVEKLCRKLLKIDENNMEALNLLAQALRKTHKIYESNRLFNKLRKMKKQYISLLE